MYILLRESDDVYIYIATKTDSFSYEVKSNENFTDFWKMEKNLMSPPRILFIQSAVYGKNGHVMEKFTQSRSS